MTQRQPVPNETSNRMSYSSFEEQSSFPGRQLFNRPPNFPPQTNPRTVENDFEEVRMQQHHVIPRNRRGGIDNTQAHQHAYITDSSSVSQPSSRSQDALPRIPHGFVDHRIQPPVSDANLHQPQDMNLSSSGPRLDHHRAFIQEPGQHQLQHVTLAPGHNPQSSFPNPPSSIPPGHFDHQVRPSSLGSSNQAVSRNIQSTDNPSQRHPGQYMAPPQSNIQSLNHRFSSVPQGQLDSRVPSINTNFPPTGKDFAGQQNFRLAAPPRVPFQNPDQNRPTLEVTNYHVPPPQMPMQPPPMPMQPPPMPMQPPPRPFLDHGQNSWQNSLKDAPSMNQPHEGYLKNKNNSANLPMSTESCTLSDMVASKVSAKPDDLTLQREEDHVWLNNFLHRKQKMCMKKPKRTFSIHEKTEHLMVALDLTNKLAELQESMASNLHSPDLGAWRGQKQEAQILQARLQEIEKVLQSMESQSEFINKVIKQRKKRQRLARLRQEKFEEKTQAAIKHAQLHEEIDAWRCKILQKEEKIKQDKELKVLADSVLGHVRKKKTDLTQTEGIIKSLEKLRQVRKEAAERKGLFTSIESDQHFKSTIAELTSLLASRQVVYDAEEETLQVMLDTEQEETKEKEREEAELNQQAANRKRAQRYQDMMFGKDDHLDPSDVRYSFWQYYDQANTNFDAFVQIRREWDSCLAPDSLPSASRIPSTWVPPEPPTSDTWASSLKS